MGNVEDRVPLCKVALRVVLDSYIPIQNLLDNTSADIFLWILVEV